MRGVRANRLVWPDIASRAIHLHYQPMLGVSYPPYLNISEAGSSSLRESAFLSLCVPPYAEISPRIALLDGSQAIIFVS
jgi:hypothetical protein